MKKTIAFACFMVLAVTLTAQDTLNKSAEKALEHLVESKIDEDKKKMEKLDADNYGWNSRIAFFVGAGTSIVANTIYELPVIDKTNNNVIIEKAGKLKPNVSAGIVYTPGVTDLVRKIKVLDENGEVKIIKAIEHVPNGISFALFINPISLAAANSNLGSTVDLGFGIGYRSGSFSAFATLEFFGMKQPRQHFVDAYSGNNLQYLIGEEVQSAIDVNDNSIFKTKTMTSIGFKLAYTFDIVSRFSSAGGK